MHLAHTSSFFLVTVLAAGSSAVACSGLVEPSPSQPATDAGPTEPVVDAGPTRDPDCAELPVPADARLCPDGTAVSGTYLVVDHRCVLDYSCPPPPPVCDLPVPALCEICSDGTTGCAHYVVESGQCVLETCPPALTPQLDAAPPPGACAQGASCDAGTGCGTQAGPDGCSLSCTCDAAGRFACTDSCAGAL